MKYLDSIPNHKPRIRKDGKEGINNKWFKGGLGLKMQNETDPEH